MFSLLTYSLYTLNFLIFILYKGKIPPQLGLISTLKSLSLSGNNELIGSIPDSFTQLVNLTSLSVEYTKIEGEVPPNLMISCTNIKLPSKSAW